MVLCYTTSINVSKTVGEIQGMLADAGAIKVLVEYAASPPRMPAALSFQIETKYGILSFRLPSRHEGIFNKLRTASRIPKRLKTEEQASRVAWRVVKRWLEVQLTFIEAEVADMEEVFFPYLQNPKDGQTFYSAIKEKKSVFHKNLICRVAYL
jgi:hypothetical protein